MRPTASSSRLERDLARGRLFLLLLGAVLLFGLALRALYFWGYAHDYPLYRSPLVDALIYDRWSQAIAGGDIWGRSEGVFYRAPLYPYLVAAVRSVADRPMPGVMLLQGVLGLFLAGAAGVLGRRLGGGLAGLIAALLVVLYGPLLSAETKLLATTLGLGLHMASLLLLVRSAETPSMSRTLSAGVVLGLSVLVRPQWLLLALVWPAVAAWPAAVDRAAVKAGARRFVPYLLGVALVVLPVAVRNRVVGGDWVLVSSNGGMTFFQGNNEENQSGLLTVVKRFELFGSATEQRALETRVAEKVAGRTLKPSETSKFFAGEAWHFILSRPADWVRLEAKKAYRFLTGYEYADNYSFYAEQERFAALRVAGLPFGVLLAAALLGCFVPIRDRATRRIVAVSALAGILSCLLFFVSSRYRMEAVPAFAVLGGVGIARWPRLWQTSRSRALVGLGAAVVALALSFLPPGAPARSQESITWLQLGNALEQQDRPDEARPAYERSVQLLPENVFAWNNLVLLVSRREAPERALELLDGAPESVQSHPISRYLRGHLYARLDREADAVNEYEAALAANPLLKEAQFALAVLYEKGRDYDGAAKHLLEARALGDESIELLGHLAYVRLQQRRWTEARAAYEELLARTPLDAEVRLNLAAACLYLGDLARASAELEAVAAANGPGEDPLLDYYRGILAWRQGRFDEAGRTLARSLAAAPSNGRALYYAELARARSAPSGFTPDAAWLKMYGAAIEPALPLLSRFLALRAAETWGDHDDASRSALSALARRAESAALARDLERYGEEEDLPDLP